MWGKCRKFASVMPVKSVNNTYNCEISNTILMIILYLCMEIIADY